MQLGQRESEAAVLDGGLSAGALGGIVQDVASDDSFVAGAGNDFSDDPAGLPFDRGEGLVLGMQVGRDGLKDTRKAFGVCGLGPGADLAGEEAESFCDTCGLVELQFEGGHAGLGFGARTDVGIGFSHAYPPCNDGSAHEEANEERDERGPACQLAKERRISVAGVRFCKWAHVANGRMKPGGAEVCPEPSRQTDNSEELVHQQP